MVCFRAITLFICLLLILVVFVKGLPFGVRGGAVPVWNSVGGGFNRFSANYSEGINSVQHSANYAFINSTDYDTVMQVCEFAD